MSVSGGNLWNEYILSFTTTIYYHYVLQESFETGLSTSPPFPLKHSLNSVTVQIAVFVFSAGFSTVLHNMVLFCCPGLHKWSPFWQMLWQNFSLTARRWLFEVSTGPDTEGVPAWNLAGTRSQLSTGLTVELKSDLVLTQLSVFSLKLCFYLSAHLHLIAVAYFGVTLWSLGTQLHLPMEHLP